MTPLHVEGDYFPDVGPKIGPKCPAPTLVPPRRSEGGGARLD